MSLSRTLELFLVAFFLFQRRQVVKYRVRGLPIRVVVQWPTVMGSWGCQEKRRPYSVVLLVTLASFSIAPL